MKIEKCIVMLMILCMFFLEGCSGIQLDTSNKILAPKNKEVPIKGTWNIERYTTVGKATLTTEEVNKLLHKTAEFDISYASFGDEICNNAEYKMKNIDAKNYFSHTHNIDLSILGLNVKDVEVISVTSSEKLFYDFIKINEKQLLVYMDSTFFYLTKISDKVDVAQKKGQIQDSEEQNKTKKENGTALKQSGVLLGLRRDIRENQEGLSYRTLWISAADCNIDPVKEIENLLVPRKTGFWIAGVNRFINEGYTNDVIFSYPIEGNKKLEELKLQGSMPGNSFRKILFVGNEYVSTEYSFMNSNGTKGIANKLQVLPLDKINDSKGISISDVSGEDGKTALITAGKTLLSSQQNNDDFEAAPSEESFGVFRRNGHWAIKGRINRIDPISDAFLDFNVNIMPPSKMVNYDSLHISWKEIKEKVPDAIDAYTSPNKDIALVVCKDIIFVYNIQGKKIGDRPLKKISIEQGETVVMAEWSTGDYVERWRKIVNSKGKVKD